MFGLGPTELIIVAAVALLLFGSRLPTMLRGLGRGIKEFRDELSDVKQDIKEVSA